MKTNASCILLDIEGTTTPIDFVYQVLFPFARKHVANFLSRHWATLQEELAELRREQTADTARGLEPPVINEAPESVVAYVHWLMDQDRKSTPLKSLQGRIWEEGYRSGELLSQVFDDVPPAMEGWHRQGRRVCIYSSGSVLAQKLLFGFTEAGDLTPLLSDYFDTAVGAKQETESYRRIAAALQLPPPEILFVSDVVAELDAAQGAGMQTALSLRPGNRPQPENTHPQIHSFAEL
ncbi:MAG TPA: acireductone synthase [Blastocatellia bacterium]|nr:acireductone synthase [Blastocatellia bacterium]HMV84643.1 acireductone synthase [Blastocatellia bacterium]HMX27118.1 acireductone synthase [Blastocatellia bacterium]HMY75024.1 acireductone synthase [Blastocatellia bacterium]HMZ18727.1 acireductone synthase [Blastocatellia bacterium]